MLALGIPLDILESLEPRYYNVSKSGKEPLVSFIASALEAAGCRLIYTPNTSLAPFRFTFETPSGARMGIMVYAFLANSKTTKNRPPDEHRFQVKYGTDDGQEHALWQDPYGLYTTLFCGIDPERKLFVGADPVLHNPTRFFMSIEFKQQHVDEIVRARWHSWERDRRTASNEPVEVLVGGVQNSFLRYVYFEREAVGEAQGHRQLLAEKSELWSTTDSGFSPQIISSPTIPHLHQLAHEFQLSEAEVLDLIASARRLKMAVRGWVAEEHLVRQLKLVEGVNKCERLDEEGAPDVKLIYQGVPLLIECKNVLRQRTASGLARMDFQRTRASKGDPCSRYYSPTEFDILAACLHAVEEKWTYRFAIPNSLDGHINCPGKLSNNVRIDSRWQSNAAYVLAEAANQRN